MNVYSIHIHTFAHAPTWDSQSSFGIIVSVSSWLSWHRI